MTTHHHISFAKSILGSATRLFRSNKNSRMLARNHIDARTMKDIGVNPLDLI